MDQIGGIRYNGLDGSGVELHTKLRYGAWGLDGLDWMGLKLNWV